MLRPRARRAALALAVFGTVPGTSLTETLDEAWALALAKDNALAAVRSQAEAAGFDAQAAHALRWPTLSVSGSYHRLDDSPAFDFSWTGIPVASPALFDNDQVVAGSAMLTVPIYTGGHVSSTIAAADARHRAVGAQVHVARADVKVAVARAYVDVLRARRGLEVARSNTRSLEALASDTNSLFERELVPRNELLTAQVALADARQNEVRASNAADVALAVYNRLVGEPMNRPAELSETIAAPVPLPDSLEELTGQALARRTELALLDAQAEAYGQLARAERSRTRPQFALSGGYRYLENQFLTENVVATAGIGVRWALFDGGRSRQRAAAFQRTRSATEQQRADMASMVELQVREAWLDLREARGRERVTADAGAQAEEGLRIARERYGAGLGTQTQLLEAETLRTRAFKNRDDAVLDAQLAELELARAVGAL